MTADLIKSLVNAEIKISELSSLILARDSNILSLEREIEQLKFDLAEAKGKMLVSSSSQTENLETFEVSLQTVDQTTFSSNLITKNESENEKISCSTGKAEESDKELTNFEESDQELVNLEENDKENSEEVGFNSELGMKKLKSPSEKQLNVISALNLRANLPLQPAFPKKIKQFPVIFYKKTKTDM